MIDAHAILNDTFPSHPFSDIAKETDYKILMENYLAMSQAFPYLQSGSQSQIFFHYMGLNQDVPEEVELTTVVGNFLSWDETGGLNLLLARGLKGLPRLLETRRFHANLLKKDCELLFGEKIKPDYSPTTKDYLINLYEGLSSLCPFTRVAYMVGFESHANNMITALWQNLEAKFKIPKNRLVYFMTHVGGNDPAEAYHVEMTHQLINKIVSTDRAEQFISLLKKSYKLHQDWCKDIINLGAKLPVNKSSKVEQAQLI